MIIHIFGLVGWFGSAVHARGTVGGCAGIMPLPEVAIARLGPVVESEDRSRTSLLSV